MTTPKNIRAAILRPTTVENPDPVAIMGRRLVDIIDRRGAIDSGPRDARAAADVRLVPHLSDQEHAITDAILSMEASSPEGALRQLMVASGLLSSLEASEIPPKDLYFERIRQLDRALYSIRGVLEELSGLDGEAMGAGYSMPDYLHPFRAVGQRAEQLAGEG